MKKQPREINGGNANRVRKGSLIVVGNKSGKVTSIEIIETFGFKGYRFTIENGDVIKVIESTF